jgi:hypothetical protein
VDKGNALAEASKRHLTRNSLVRSKSMRSSENAVIAVIAVIAGNGKQRTPTSK